MAGPNPAQQSPTILQRLARMKKLRNLQLALDLLGSQPSAPEMEDLEPAAQEHRMQEEHVDLLEEDGGSGGGGGGGVGQMDRPRRAYVSGQVGAAQSVNLGASTDMARLDPLKNAYALRAARTAGMGNLPDTPARSADKSTDAAKNFPQEAQGAAEEAEGTAPEQGPESNETTDPTNDPVYRLQQGLNEARQEAEVATANAQSQGAQGAIATASKYSDGAWLSWMWASIPGMLGDFGFNFALATVASWVSMLRTVMGSVFVKMLGSGTASALPPPFSFLPLASTKAEGKTIWQISSGLSSFAFFCTAHLIWLFLAIVIVMGLIQVYLLTAPYIEAASSVCRYITIHPLCLIAPK